MTGNLINDNGVTGDLISGVEEGDLTGGLADVYADIIGRGGVINNLGDGYGLGIETLLGNVLGTADELLGAADSIGNGLLDGVVGDESLLGDVLGEGGLIGGGLLGSAGDLDDLLDGGLLG
ncbi:hypothetical protein [Nitratireductor sp. ZSWI3]|uniref:hypothetical protein n=1 Tax=Nitratireductor sp. ZSWI3 TaxID=2966359 RepID=UPI0021504D3E|nr:hypothetical protein [Nitratireductor sp. ZSWI3]MCR4265869.1 hypothetical protein [Nitratireductor sp. ZSWI3]